LKNGSVLGKRGLQKNKQPNKKVPVWLKESCQAMMKPKGKKVTGRFKEAFKRGGERVIQKKPAPGYQ